MAAVDLIDIEEFDAYTGKSRWNAVYTIQLGQLIESGVFSFENELFNWESAAYDTATYSRLCEYFIARFYYREISIEPLKQWANVLMRKIKFEICPKYNLLYARYAEGLNPLAASDEYFKRRSIDSDYPETLLSGNADYASFGNDQEEERVKEGNAVEQSALFAERFRAIDAQFMDELECMFIGLYTTNVNGF